MIDPAAVKPGQELWGVWFDDSQRHSPFKMKVLNEGTVRFENGKTAGLITMKDLYFYTEAEAIESALKSTYDSIKELWNHKKALIDRIVEIDKATDLGSKAEESKVVEKEPGFKVLDPNKTGGLKP